MPQVPLGQRQVQRKILPNAEVTTKAPVNLFGGEASQLGALAETAKEGFGLVDRIDTLEADRAAGEAIKAKNEHLYGKKDEEGNELEPGYFSKGGKDAMVGMDEYKKKMQDSYKGIEASLSNDRQREKFRQQVAKIDIEVDGQMKRHALGEAQKYDDQETMATIKNYQADAVANYKVLGAVNDQGQRVSKVREVLQKQEDILSAYAERKGYPADSEFSKNLIKQAKTDTHTGIIERMISNDEDLYAKEYLAQVKKSGDLEAKAIPHLEKLVEAGSLRGESQRVSDKIIDQNVGMDQALKLARDIKEPKLQDEVVTRLKVRYAEAETVKKEVQDQTFNSAYAYLEENKTLDGLPPQQLASLSVDQKQKLKKMAVDISSGKLTETDPDTYYNLRLMSAAPETREKFAKLNLTTYRDKLSGQAFKEMVHTQEGIIKGDERVVKGLDGFRSDTQVVDQALASVGITKKKNPDLYNQFAIKVDSLVERRKEENGGKGIPNTELQKIVNEQLIEGTVPGTGIFGIFKTKKRLFQVDRGENLEIDIDSLPKDDVEKIKRVLEKKGKRTTNSNIIEVYRKAKGV